MLIINQATGERLNLEVPNLLDIPRLDRSRTQYALDTVNYIIENRTDFSDIVLEMVSFKYRLEEALELVDERAARFKASARRGKRGPNTKTFSQEVKDAAKDLGIKTSKAKAVKLVQAGAQGTGKRK